MKLLYLVVFLGLVAIAAASESERVFLERCHAIDAPRDWSWAGAAPADAQISLTIALKGRNAKTLEKFFWAISTPGDELFHQYLTMDQLAELVAPEDATIAAVSAWLSTFGIQNPRMPLTRDHMLFTTTVATAEAMLDTKYWSFVHETGKNAVSSYGPYTVPAELEAHIVLVAGVTGFPLISKTESAPAAAADTWTVGPANLRQVYGVPSTKVATNSKTTQAVAEFQGQFYSPSDLATFWSTEKVTWAPVPTLKVVGTNSPAKPGVEASLDVQYLTSVGAGAATTFYSYPNFNFFNDLITWTSDVLSESNPPFVHSVSYGDQSLSQEPSTTYKAQLDSQFQKMGALGLTVLFSSGDSGAGCQLCTKLSPSYPAGSPYVTAVGATTFQTTVGSTQTAVTAFGSGGGFDWTETPASYQTAAIKKYFNQGQPNSFYPPTTSYNAQGRGTPDVSALGWGFVVINAGAPITVGGTSASSPTFAGVLTLINDALFNAGKPALGFINPWLYQNPSILTDITIGNNDHTCCKGWQCSAGWDPVTGLGTPNYQPMLTSALAQ